MASRTRRFFLNAITLTAAALIMRAVSVIFNVYISNKAGSEAMGLFSLLGSIYAFSMTVATAGINLGVTRLVSDALAKNRRGISCGLHRHRNDSGHTAIFSRGLSRRGGAR